MLAEAYNSADEGMLSDLDRMDRGDCTAAIVYQDVWLDARINQTVHCDTKVRLRETTLSIPVGLPINPEIFTPVSWLLESQISQGEYTRLAQRATVNFTKNVCFERDPAEDVTLLGLEAMYGPLMFLFIVSSLSLIVTRIGRRADVKARQLREKLDVDGDGRITTQELRNTMREQGSRMAHRRMGTSRKATLGVKDSGEHQHDEEELAAQQLPSTPGVYADVKHNQGRTQANTHRLRVDVRY